MEKADPEEGWLKTSQIQMRYLDWGRLLPNHRRGTASGVVALHGLASSCHWYDLLIPHLTHTYRFIAPDQRGHGQTDQPPSGYDWDTLSGDIVEAMDQLGLSRVSVIGHSWGASVALGVAARYPDRISALVLIDGGFFDWTLWPGASWEWFKDTLRPRIVSGTSLEYLESQRRLLPECWVDQLESIVMSMVRITPDGTVRDILEPSNHAQVLEAMWNEPPSTVFHLIQSPTLIVSAEPRRGRGHGEFARIKRESASAAESAISDCRVEWIPDTIHDIGYHKPQMLARVLRSFLPQE